MKVIENELEDKNYVYQYRVLKYSLDFAWPTKKLYIEIDGGQHKYTEEYDNIRDNALKENGWIGLRIPWLYFYNYPKETIKDIKNFIDNGVILLEKFQIKKSNVLKLDDKIKIEKKRIYVRKEKKDINYMERLSKVISREDLKFLIRVEPFTHIAERYGVTDNAVRKWCDKYSLPRHSREIKRISDEDWEKI